MHEQLSSAGLQANGRLPVMTHPFHQRTARQNHPGKSGEMRDVRSVVLTTACIMQEDKCDIKALIEFESVAKGDKGDTLNALRFNILVEDV